MSAFIQLLTDIDDPRQSAKIHYPLVNILFISFCAIFYGAEGWHDIGLFAEYKQDWLSQYIDMSCGIPSYFTIRRLFCLIDPSEIGALTRMITRGLLKPDEPIGHIAIDGKSLRGNKSAAKGIKPLQIVSAWCESQGLSLAEVAVDKKSNEITAIPLLLDLLELKGSTVSIDAMGAQEKIARQILEKDGDYVLALKGNKGNLHKTVKAYMEAEGADTPNLLRDYFDHSHGRDVRRRYFSCSVPESVKEFGFPGMQSLIATETISNKQHDSKVTAEWRYYISSHPCDTSSLPDVIRGHWAVENKLHWVLDVHLKDDADRKLDRRAADNFSRIKRFIINMVRKNDTDKDLSVGRKLKKILWDDEYLKRILLS